KRKRAYNNLNDFAKVRKQWRKLSGLHTREEWSAAVVRAVTAAEIATNIVIREEFTQNSSFDADVVNTFLKDANGINGKVNKLLKCLLAGRPDEYRAVQKLYKALESAVQKRNSIAHGGEFCGEPDASKHIAACKKY